MLPEKLLLSNNRAQKHRKTVGWLIVFLLLLLMLFFVHILGLSMCVGERFVCQFFSRLFIESAEDKVRHGFNECFQMKLNLFLSFMHSSLFYLLCHTKTINLLSSDLLIIIIIIIFFSLIFRFECHTILIVLLLVALSDHFTIFLNYKCVEKTRRRHNKSEQIRKENYRSSILIDREAKVTVNRKYGKTFFTYKSTKKKGGEKEKRAGKSAAIFVDGKKKLKCEKWSEQ